MYVYLFYSIYLYTAYIYFTVYMDLYLIGLQYIFIYFGLFSNTENTHFLPQSCI